MPAFSASAWVATTCEVLLAGVSVKVKNPGISAAYGEKLSKARPATSGLAVLPFETTLSGGESGEAFTTRSVAGVARSKSVELLPNASVSPSTTGAAPGPTFWSAVTIRSVPPMRLIAPESNNTGVVVPAAVIRISYEPAGTSLGPIAPMNATLPLPSGVLAVKAAPGAVR